MKKVLIIGSNGYIGTYLKNKLKKKFKLILPTHSNSEFDVLKIKTLQKKIKKNLFAVINLSGQNSLNKKILKKTIIEGNKNLIKTINKINRDILYIFVSTALVYGFKKKPAKETNSCNPTSFYGKLKLEAEKLIIEKCSNFKILRLCNVYGEKINNGFFKKIFESLIKQKKIYFSNLKTKRNLIHIIDVTKAIELALDYKKIKNQSIINIGNQNLSLIDFLKLLQIHSGKKINYVNHQNSLRKDSSQIISNKKFLRIKNWKLKDVKNTIIYNIKKYAKHF